MKKRISIITAGILILSSMNVYATGTNDLKNKQKENNTKIEQKNQEKSKIKEEKESVSSEIDKLIDEMKSLENEVNILWGKVSTANNQITEKSNNINKLESEIIESEKNIVKQESEIKEKNIELEENNEILNQRVRAAYKYNSFNTTIFILLESESILDFTQRLMAIDRMAKKDREIIKKGEKLLEELDLKKESLNKTLLLQTEIKENLQKEKQALDEKKMSLEKQNKELTGKTNELKDLEKEKKVKFSNLTSVEKDLADEILDIREENEALENEIQVLVKRAAEKAAAERAAAEKAAAEKAQAEKDKANSNNGSGDTTNPPKEEKPTPSSGYIKPIYGRVTSGYGMRLHPIHNVYRMHTGIDIAASSGTPIKATRSGTVIFSGYYGGYGNTVMILHDTGLTSLYAHMSGYNTSIGANVSQGQTIGYVGSTGDSTGPHLHFEMRNSGGSHINPNPYVGYY